MGERVAFSAKATADMRRDYAHMGLRQTQHLAYLAMDIMRSLRRGPEREFAADGIGGHGFPAGNAGMRLHRCVIVAFVIKPVFAHIVCLRETSINLAKFI